jgi:hypothetical protein
MRSRLAHQDFIPVAVMYCTDGDVLTLDLLGEP